MLTPVYYCNINNFGDKLNEDILKLFFKNDIRFATLDSALVMGIDSLLDNILQDKNDIVFEKSPLYIFSTGFGFEEGGFFHNPNIVLPEKLKRNVKCYALRGKLTKERIEKLTNTKQECCLGDAGLLSYLLIDKNKIQPKYELGIVPHYADKDNEIFKQLCADNPDSIILDITKPPAEFLKDLASCKTIASTAMHPLIASDALGIPNMWIRISDKTTSLYKFRDYYSVYSIDEPQPFYLDGSNYKLITPDYIKKNYAVDSKEVHSIQQELTQNLHALATELDKQKFRYMLKKICAFLFSVKRTYKRVAITFLGIKLKIKG